MRNHLGHVRGSGQMRRAGLSALLFIPLAMPAALLAIGAVAFGCLATLLASVAGWLLDLFDRAISRRDLTIVADLSPGGDKAVAAVFRDGKFQIIDDDDLAADVAKLRERGARLQ